MAGEEVVHVDEGYANAGGPKDGPVLTMMSKRLRALRKKYNRILQIEEQKKAGKPVNKEQEEVLKTKIAIAALIDEYEKLRQPLQVAVREEVAERERELMTATLQRREEEESVGDEKEETALESKKEEAAFDGNSREADPEQADAIADETAGDGGNDQAVSSPRDEVVVREYEEGVLAAEESGLQDYQSQEQLKDGASFKDGVSDGELADLLKLLYFAQLFDVRSQGEAPSFVWTKLHERSSCLSYDFVTDDATSPLLEKDLDALSLFGSMLVSRPPNVTLSHKDALQRCIQHARQWLDCSDDVIQDNLDISYSRLRDRLNRILSSEYFTMTPELQTVSQQTAAAAATAAVQYVSKVLVHEGSVGSIGDVEEGSGYFGHQDQPVSQQQYYQTRADFVAPPQLAGANGLPVGHVIPANGPYAPDNQAIAVDIPQFGSHEDGSQSAINPDTSLDQDQAQLLQPPPPQQPHKLQQHPGGPRNGGGYQQGAPRGGRHGGPGGYGMGGGGRGYPNGRGGRGGRGGYPNGGRGGYYEQGNYHNRNHFGGRGGRGGRGSVYNGHVNGPPPAQAPPIAAEAST